MFIKKLFCKTQYEKYKSKHFIKNKWIINHQTVADLAILLSNEDVDSYDIRDGARIRIHCVHKNVIELLNLLDSACDVVRNKIDVPNAITKSRNHDNVSSIRLDDYLVTNANIPLKPKEFLHGLVRVLSTLNTELSNLKDKEQREYNYYVRQFTHLMNETFTLLLGLVEALVNERKQKSRTDVII